jgi:integrase
MPSNKVRTGIDRLYIRTGKRKTSWYYQYPDGSSDTLATAPTGDKKAIANAERIAQRKALELQQGSILAGSVAQLIERFADEVDESHYLDQSKEGRYIRAAAYANLIKFFGRMTPNSLEKNHGYQFIEARAAVGAPKKAWKELYTFSTICEKAVRWGVMKANPFTNMGSDDLDVRYREVSRSQVVRFYFWSRRQDNRVERLMGSMALFIYLTGFRVAEVRPLLKSNCKPEGVTAIGAKRKKGRPIVLKIREWSMKLRMVVKRIEQDQKHMTSMPKETAQMMAQIATLIKKGETAKYAAAAAGMKESTYYYWRNRMKKDERVKPMASLYMFPSFSGQCYTKGGLSSSWEEAMLSYVKTIDESVTTKTLTQNAEYFSPLDVRPAAITTKLRRRDLDAYDFAAHANPSTTHLHYDRRRVLKAKATE